MKTGINEKQCTGCGSCIAICPKKAIEMELNEEGFLLPSFKIERCVDCGLCSKICPINMECYIENRNPIAYAMQAKQDEVRLNSSSGGVFSILAEKILEENGIVFGAVLDSNLIVRHLSISNKNEMWKLRGSKYIQSDINVCYQEVKEYLRTGRKVMFSGTPCQIQGLVSMLRKKYDNLICIDFICMGITGPGIWSRYIQEKQKRKDTIISGVNFRDKTYGWKKPAIMYCYEDGSSEIIPHEKDQYMQLFRSKIILQHSCYTCKFRTINRISDITLGDFWGINRIKPELDDNLGTSLVLVHSEEGKELIEKINKSVLLEQVDIERVKLYNPAIYCEFKKPRQRDDFFKDMKKNTLSSIMNYYIKRYVLFEWLFKRGFEKARRVLSFIQKK